MTDQQNGSKLTSRVLPYDHSLRETNTQMRFISNKKEPVPDECICYKPSGTILCTACGQVFYGRLRKLCDRHPRTIFLMDIEQCHLCHACIFMLHEVDEGPKKLHKM